LIMADRIVRLFCG